MSRVLSLDKAYHNNIQLFFKENVALFSRVYKKIFPRSIDQTCIHFVLLFCTRENSNESQTKDESSRSSEASCSSTQPHVSEKLDSTESTDEEDINTTEKFSISGEEGRSEIKSVADGQSDEENNGDKEEDPTATTLDEVGQADMEIDEKHDPDQHISQFDSEPSMLLSFKDISNVEVTTHEFGLTDDGGDQQASETVDEEIVDSNREQNAKNDEAVESFLSSELVDVDVCATELGETQKAEEGTIQENTDVEEDKDLTPQLEENAKLLQSKQDFTQDSQQEDNDQAQKNNKGERTEAKASYGETSEVLALSENDLDDSVMPNDSSVEISFEDAPEAQGIPAVEGKSPVQGASVEIAQNTKLEMQQKEESMELTATSAHQNMSDSEDQLKFATEKDKKESNSEEEESHATFAITKEKVDTNNSNQNDNEKEISVKGISSSDQPITEAEDEIQEHETAHEDTEEIFERRRSQNQEPEKKQQSKDVEQDEMAGTSGEDEESYTEMGNREITDVMVEEKSSHAIKSNTSISGKESEAETFDKALPLENKQSPRTGQPQPENISDIKEVTSEEEEECMEKMTDSEVHQKSKEMEEEENLSLARSADWTAADLEEEDRPDESEENTTASVNKVDKVILLRLTLHTCKFDFQKCIVCQNSRFTTCDKIVLSI